MEEKSVNRYFVLPEGASIEDYFGGKGKIDDNSLAEYYNQAESFTEKSLPPGKGNVLIFTLDKKKKEIVLEFLIDAKQGTSSDFKSQDAISAKRTFKASLVKPKKEKKKGILSGLLRRGSRSRSGSTSSMSSAGSDARSRARSTSSQQSDGRAAASEGNVASSSDQGIYAGMTEGVDPFAHLGPGASKRPAVSEVYDAFDPLTRKDVVDDKLQKELESQYFSDLKREMWSFVEDLKPEKVTSQTKDLKLILDKFNKRFGTNIDNQSGFDSLNLRDFFQYDHIKTAINEKAAQMIQSKEDVIEIIKANPKIHEGKKPIDETQEMAYEIAETINAAGFDVARIKDKDGQYLENIIDDIKYLVEKNIYFNQKVVGSHDLFELELKYIIDNAKPDKKEAEFSKLKAKYAIKDDIKLDEYFAVGEDDELTETKEKIMDSLSAQIKEEVDKKYNYKKFISDGRFPKGLVPATRSAPAAANVGDEDGGTYALPKKVKGGSNLPGQEGGGVAASAAPAASAEPGQGGEPIYDAASDDSLPGQGQVAPASIKRKARRGPASLPGGSGQEPLFDDNPFKIGPGVGSPEEQNYGELPGQGGGQYATARPAVPAASDEDQYMPASEQPGYEHYADSNPSQRTPEEQNYGQLPGQEGGANLTDTLGYGDFTNASASSADQGEDLQDIIKGSWNDAKGLYTHNLRERFFETVMYNIRDKFGNIEEHPESLEEIANFVGLPKSDLEDAKVWPDVETKIMPTIVSRAVEILGKKLPPPPRPAKGGKKTKMQSPEEKPYATARAATEDPIYDKVEARDFRSLVEGLWSNAEGIYGEYNVDAFYQSLYNEIYKKINSAGDDKDHIAKIKDLLELPKDINLPSIEEMINPTDNRALFDQHILGLCQTVIPKISEISSATEVQREYGELPGQEGGQYATARGVVPAAPAGQGQGDVPIYDDAESLAQPAYMEMRKRQGAVPAAPAGPSQEGGQYATARDATEESIYDLDDATSPNFESMAKFYWNEIKSQESYKTFRDKRKALFDKITIDLSANLKLDDVKIKDFYNLPDDISAADLKKIESNPEIRNKFIVHINKVLSETLDNYPKGHSVESQQVYVTMNPGGFEAAAAAVGARAASSISHNGDSTKHSLSSADAIKALREAGASTSLSDEGTSSSDPLSSAYVKKAAAALKVKNPEVKPKPLKPEVAKNNKKIELYEKRIGKINESINAAEDMDKLSSLEEQLMVLYLEQEKLLNENITQETDLISKNEYQKKAKQVREHYEGYLEAYVSTDTEKKAMVSAFSDKREEKEIQESILKHKAQRENYLNISPRKSTEIYSEKTLEKTLEKIIEIDHKIQAELISLEAKDAKSAAEFVKANGLEYQSKKAEIYATSKPKVLEEEKSINPVVKAEMERLIPGMRTYLGEELYYENVAPSTISEEFKKEFGMDISEDEFRDAKYDVEKFLSSKVFLDSLKKKAGENIEKSSEIELSNLLKDLRKAPEEGKYQYLDQIASKYMLKDIPLDELAKYDGKSSPIHEHLKERVAYAAISRDAQKKEPHKMWNELFNEIYSAMDVQDSKAKEGLLDKIDFKYKLGMTTSEIEEMLSDSIVSEKIQKRAFDSIKTTCQINAEKSIPKFENSTSGLWKGDIAEKQRQALVKDLIAKVKNVSEMTHVFDTPTDIRIEAERKILNQVSNAFRILQSRGATPEELKDLNKNINLERGKINTKAEIDIGNVREVELQVIDLKDPRELSPQEAAVRSKRLIEEAQKRAAEGAEKRKADKKKVPPPVAPKPSRTKTTSAAGG